MKVKLNPGLNSVERSKLIKKLSECHRKHGLFERNDSKCDVDMEFDKECIEKPVDFRSRFSNCIMSNIGSIVTTCVLQACSTELNWSLDLRIHAK